MKKIILITVLTLVMLTPALAADGRTRADSWLVASNQQEKPAPKPPKKVIIKGKGGKVTGVEQGNGKKSKRKK